MIRTRVLYNREVAHGQKKKIERCTILETDMWTYWILTHRKKMDSKLAHGLTIQRHVD
jgi:hypothetical protein